MNRRQVIASVGLAALPMSAIAQQSQQAEVMTMLIEEVIRDGDMSNLPDIVNENVTIATLGVSDIAAFEEVSRQGYEERQSEFAQMSMDIVSLAEHEDWVHTLVRAIGEEHGGRNRQFMLFYVAQFRDGRISSLYFG